MEIAKVKIQNKTNISFTNIGILINLVQVSNYRTRNIELISTWIKNEFQVEINKFLIKEYFREVQIENFEDEGRRHIHKLLNI